MSVDCVLQGVECSYLVVCTENMIRFSFEPHIVGLSKISTHFMDDRESLAVVRLIELVPGGGDNLQSLEGVLLCLVKLVELDEGFGEAIVGECRRDVVRSNAIELLLKSLPVQLRCPLVIALAVLGIGFMVEVHPVLEASCHVRVRRARDRLEGRGREHDSQRMRGAKEC